MTTESIEKPDPLAQFNPDLMEYQAQKWSSSTPKEALKTSVVFPGKMKADYFKPKTAGEFFFSDPQGFMHTLLSSSDIDNIYNDYIKILVCMYDKLKEKYNLLSL